jgi:hypothetical protein
MTYGIRTINTTYGIITIDDTLPGYRYMGKYAIANGVQTINVSCSGFPLLFFGLPYGLSDSSGSTTLGSQLQRYGIHIAKVAPVSTGVWAVTVRLENPDATNLGLYLRVFGRINANPPTNVHWGIRISGPTGMMFDSGARMLRLAGHTYDVELALSDAVPAYGAANNSCDQNVTMPFSMSGKSICANPRGQIFMPYNYDSYFDWDGGQTINRYRTIYYDTMYYATGSQLQARKVGTNDYMFESVDPYLIGTENGHVVYTRIAVIDNSKFP